MSYLDPALANRYADALFRAATKRGVAQAIVEQAAAVADPLRRDKRINRFFEAPDIGTEVKEKFIVYAGPAVRRFRRLVERAAGIRQADVVSARPLDDDEKQRLTRSLEAFTSSKLRIRWSVDPRIIGGIRFTCDDLLVDNSVRMHLDTLRSRLEAVMHH